MLAEWTYRFRVDGIGRVRFEGLALQMADLQGFFYHTTFLPWPESFASCRPSMKPDRTEQGRPSKRRNLLLPPGVHRHRKPVERTNPGYYRPGDPPKTIAWNSA